MKQIHMVDVVGQYKKIKQEIDSAALRVIESGQYILGPDVAEFEREVAQYLGVKHAIACSSGTDALLASLLALNIKPGDEVITTAFTFVATVETIVLLQAEPIFIEIDERTFNLDPTYLEKAITSRTKAIIPVHLYGHPVDMDPLLEVATKYGIPVIEDMCQAIGAEYKGKKVGTLGTIGCISFFPSKNLGGFGDGGMVITNDSNLAEQLRMIIVHGSRERYKHEVIGINGRLDTLQAAMLRVKLRYLDKWNQTRREAARRYNELLTNTLVQIPYEAPYAKHVYHQYTIRVPKRDTIVEHLSKKNIPHAVYYPIPLHLQPAYTTSKFPKGSLPLTEKASREVLSLPMHTELEHDQQAYIVESILEALK
ncbi:MAG: DegT/DnrJ/EryC1/StrS family aminotransferase [Bacteroidetes bacterium]|nr:DegT/DnrJ/EryC1/StrS family aminotransferase [Bacteroidota bacterium]